MDLSRENSALSCVFRDNSISNILLYSDWIYLTLYIYLYLFSIIYLLSVYVLHVVAEIVMSHCSFCTLQM